MKVLIFCGGHIEDYSRLVDSIEGDIIICADGGARHLRALNLIPDLLLGDFDSINKEDYNYYREKDVKILKFPEDKDYTDTELAIEEAFTYGASEITLIGATGGRLDHTLANVFLLKKILEKGIIGKIITGSDELILTKDYARINGNSSDKLTILALDKEVIGVTTVGLLYQLKDETLYCGSSRGVSNSFIANFGEVFVKKGILMIIKSRE